MGSRSGLPTVVSIDSCAASTSWIDYLLLVQSFPSLRHKLQLSLQFRKLVKTKLNVVRLAIDIVLDK